MNLSSFLTRNMVAAKLSSGSQRQVIEQVVGRICSRMVLRNQNEILSAILSREEQLGTVIGEGVAVPHARIENLREPILFVATLNPSISYWGNAQEPVDIIFLFITPAAASNTHLK